MSDSAWQQQLIKINYLFTTSTGLLLVLFPLLTDIFDHYEEIEFLGQGGFALEPILAIKTLEPILAIKTLEPIRALKTLTLTITTKPHLILNYMYKRHVSNLTDLIHIIRWCWLRV